MADPLGTDLQVIPHFAAHDAESFDLVPRQVAVRPRRGPRVLATDLATLSGRENLAQALILRLLTPQGALAALGHAGYGSRLHELIGRNKSEALRSLCRAFVLEAVAQEPRVENTVLALTFDRVLERPETFVFSLSVQPRHDAEPLTLALEVGL